MKDRSRVHVAAISAATMLLTVMAPALILAQHQHAAPSASRSAESPAAVQAEEEMRVGNKGEVTFTGEVKVRGIALKPGTYEVRHHADGADHFVHFKAVATTYPSAQKTATGLPLPTGAAEEIWCEIETLPESARETAVYLRHQDGATRVTRIVIKGENVAHVFR